MDGWIDGQKVMIIFMHFILKFNCNHATFNTPSPQKASLLIFLEIMFPASWLPYWSDLCCLKGVKDWCQIIVMSTWFLRAMRPCLRFFHVVLEWHVQNGSGCQILKNPEEIHWHSLRQPTPAAPSDTLEGSVYTTWSRRQLRHYLQSTSVKLRHDQVYYKLH